MALHVLETQLHIGYSIYHINITLQYLKQRYAKRWERCFELGTNYQVPDVLLIKNYPVVLQQLIQ